MELTEYLKKHTMEIHRETERKSIARNIMNGRITMEDYGIHLKRLHYAYSTVEAACEDFVQDRPHHPVHEFLDTGNTALLRKDIHSLDATYAYQAKSSYKISSLSELVGALYVTLGSGLGGLLIAKRLKSCHGLTLEKHNFYSGKNNKVLENWKDFKKIINSSDTLVEKRDQVLGSAISTFGLFASK